MREKLCEYASHEQIQVEQEGGQQGRGVRTGQTLGLRLSAEDVVEEKTARSDSLSDLLCTYSQDSIRRQTKTWMLRVRRKFKPPANVQSLPHGTRLAGQAGSCLCWLRSEIQTHSSKEPWIGLKRANFHSGLSGMSVRRRRVNTPHLSHHGHLPQSTRHIFPDGFAGYFFQFSKLASEARNQSGNEVSFLRLNQ